MSENEKKIFLCEDSKKQRLDAFLAERAEISRAQAKKAIDNGLCLVNTKQVKADYKVKRSDEIEFTLIVPVSELIAEEGHLEILYQDNDYVIINKPHNLTVHPAPSQETGTLVHLLLSHFPSMREMEGLRPGIVHRIDKDTTGILVIALHDKARRALGDLFALREVKKEYLALVHNVPKREQTIDLPIGRHESNKTKMAVSKNGKDALTEFSIVDYDINKNYALLSVRIHTGRTHQIRVHLSHIGFPLWGDKSYTNRIMKPVPTKLKEVATRQMLHAWKINFIQPLTGEEINIECPIPEDMQHCLKRLQDETKKYIVTGNAGCGKSLLLEMAKEKGYPTFSADLYVKELYAKDGAGTFLLSRMFGEEILAKHGGIDTNILLSIMQDSHKRERIEKAIHPLVYRAMNEFFEKAEEDAYEKAFAEIPLYFETSPEKLDEEEKYITVCVFAEEKTRKERLYARSWSEETIEFFDSLQLPIEEKKQKADLVFENSISKEDFLKKIEELF